MIETMETEYDMRKGKFAVLAIQPAKDPRLAQAVFEANRSLESRCNATGVVSFINPYLTTKDLASGINLNTKGRRKVAAAILHFVTLG